MIVIPLRLWKLPDAPGIVLKQTIVRVDEREAALHAWAAHVAAHSAHPSECCNVSKARLALYRFGGGQPPPVAVRDPPGAGAVTGAVCALVVFLHTLKTGGTTVAKWMEAVEAATAYTWDFIPQHGGTERPMCHRFHERVGYAACTEISHPKGSVGCDWKNYHRHDRYKRGLHELQLLQSRLRVQGPAGRADAHVRLLREWHHPAGLNHGPGQCGRTWAEHYEQDIRPLRALRGCNVVTATLWREPTAMYLSYFRWRKRLVWRHNRDAPTSIVGWLRRSVEHGFTGLMHEAPRNMQSNAALSQDECWQGRANMTDGQILKVAKEQLTLTLTLT